MSTLKIQSALITKMKVENNVYKLGKK